MISLGQPYFLYCISGETLQFIFRKPPEITLRIVNIRGGREKENSYTFAGTQLKNILGDAYKVDLINNTIQALLGKQQLHKTYADLCVESVISQLQVSTFRVNIFTQDYEDHLQQRLTEVIKNHLGDKYMFNLSVEWRPINLLPFGGSCHFGQTPPPNKDTHVAESFVSLPETQFSTWLGYIDTFIQETILNDPEFQDFQQMLQDLDESKIRENLTRLVTNLVNATLFDGFTISTLSEPQPGIIAKAIDYVFDKIQNSLEDIFDNALGQVQSMLGKFGDGGLLNMSFCKNIETVLFNAVAENLSSFIPGFNITDVDGDGIDFKDVISSIKIFVVTWARELIFPLLQGYINQFVDYLMTLLDPLLEPLDQLQHQLDGFFNGQMNVLRAKIRLTIWEVRS